MMTKRLKLTVQHRALQIRVQKPEDRQGQAPSVSPSASRACRKLGSSRGRTSAAGSVSRPLLRHLCRQPPRLPPPGAPSVGGSRPSPPQQPAPNASPGAQRPQRPPPPPTTGKRRGSFALPRSRRRRPAGAPPARFPAAPGRGRTPRSAPSPGEAARPRRLRAAPLRAEATLRARGAAARSGRAAPPRPVSHPAWERARRGAEPRRRRRAGRCAGGQTDVRTDGGCGGSSAATGPRVPPRPAPASAFAPPNPLAAGGEQGRALGAPPDWPLRPFINGRRSRRGTPP